MNPDPLAEIIAHHEAEAVREERSAEAAWSGTPAFLEEYAGEIEAAEERAEMHRRFAATLKAAVDAMSETGETT